MRDSGWKPEGVTKYLNTPKKLSFEEFVQIYGMNFVKVMLKEFLEVAWIDKQEIINKKRAKMRAEKLEKQRELEKIQAEAKSDEKVENTE